MGTLGPATGGTFASDGTLGTITVSSPANAQLSDNIYANCGLLLGQISNYLKVTNFGLNVPTDATITGLTMSIERNATSLTAISDNSVRLVKNGIISGTDKASATPWTTSDAIATYGSSSDMWGISLTPTDVNSTTFGVVINAVASLAATVNIDQVLMTVDYIGSNHPGSLRSEFKSGNGMSVTEGVS